MTDAIDGDDSGVKAVLGCLRREVDLIEELLCSWWPVVLLSGAFSALFRRASGEWLELGEMFLVFFELGDEKLNLSDVVG